MQNSSPSRKQKQITQLPTIAQYFRTLPINLPLQLVTLINTLNPINESFKNNLSTLTVYRANLGLDIEKNWIHLLNFSKKLIWQIDTIVKRKQKEHKDTMDLMAKQREKMDDEIRQLRDKLHIMTTLKELQQGQAQQYMVEVETLRKEITQIHKIVQKDMDKVMQYLIVLEKSERTDVSNEIFSCIERLALSLNRLQDESNTSEKTLTKMQKVIKVMVRNNKTDAFTQLEECQLQSRAQRIFPQNRQKVSIQRIQTSSLNLTGELSRELNKHALDQLRIKQHEYPPELVNKKNPQNAWVLPPSVVLFLQNMAKQNENGKVLPWQHVKKLIYQVYSERISHKKEIFAGLVGNAVPMDQFIVMLFIRKYNMRRLAQLKLLQFLISIKYYTKFWLKAQTFAAVLDIMRINPYFQVNDSNSYKFDIHAQNFFFYLLGTFDKSDLSQQQDGSTYIQFELLKTKLKPLLCFCQDLNKSRLFAKLEKTLRLQEKVEYVDFDMAINFSVEEYFYSKKQRSSELGKAFNKANEMCEGYFSIKQIAAVFTEFENQYQKGQDVFGHRFPATSGLQLCKLYLYAVTSGKNGFLITNKQFLSTCQRFGFDSPVPFLHQCTPKNKRRSKLQKSVSLSHKQTLSQQFVFDPKSTKDTMMSPPLQYNSQSLSTQAKVVRQNPYNKRIQIGTFMFSQHFTILRQLQEYCNVFKSQLGKETDNFILWTQFQNILKVLDKGCQFLKYPLKH